MTSAVRRVDPLRRQTGLAREVVIERLVEGFRARFGLVDGPVTDPELARAQELIDTKFATPEWLHRVP
ncbi:hypothetical protein [Saccharopolyspora sp. CA-218241]|uniref:hypothetical protein n=1 Tax=Saccharopolyspora sp. CA-218241 TaxID=3240027 RepID=UPI003D95211D